MDGANQMKLGIWLANKKLQPWARGINDCCTLFMEYHDHMFGTDTVSSIYGKYNNLRSAIKLRKEFPTTDVWFPEHGYTQVEQPQTGDIVMVEQRWFPSSYIVCQTTAWGLEDNSKGMSRHNLNKPQFSYSIWRHESWA